MSPSDSTCWTVIQEAASGGQVARDAFARRYAPVVRAYLARRWRGLSLQDSLDDAVQEVFVDCFREGGVLHRADRTRPSGFRAFLYGVVRIVALRIESERAKSRECQPPSGFDPGEIERREATLSRVFDREWARAVLREATELQTLRAKALGDAAVKRVELLRLRFGEELPIRDIAARWGAEAKDLYREYAIARQEFKASLFDVVSFHHPSTPGEVERECAELMTLLQ